MSYKCYTTLSVLYEVRVTITCHANVHSVNSLVTLISQCRRHIVCQIVFTVAGCMVT